MLALVYLCLLGILGLSFTFGAVLVPFHAVRIRLTQAERDEWHGSTLGGLRVAIRHWRSSWSWRLFLTSGIAACCLLLARLILGEP